MAANSLIERLLGYSIRKTVHQSDAVKQSPRADDAENPAEATKRVALGKRRAWRRDVR
jgi:hypothetical protein